MIEILTEEVDKNSPGDYVISGGQRRDWLFSAPVAYKLKKQHVSLFKDGTAMEIRNPLKKDSSPKKDFSGKHVAGRVSIHISDLLTTGSSAYDDRKAPPTGWIPQLREAGAGIYNIYAVVSRLQEGEENLKRHGVTACALLYIDGNFLAQHSQQPLIACHYYSDPHKWSEKYLREHGIDTFVGAFAPEKMAKDKRAASFLYVYEKVLNEPRSGKGTLMNELRQSVQDRYGLNIFTLPKTEIKEE